MSPWESIRKRAEEGTGVLKDGVSVANTSRILKKRVELTSVQGNVQKDFIRLGSLAYELHSTDERDFYGSEEVKGLITRIEGHKTRVQEIESEIETIRQEERRNATPTAEQPLMPYF
jgi:hypothetical protein